MKLRRSLAVLLSGVMLCILMIFPTSAAEVCFTSINDNLLPLTSNTMPVWSGGVLYVPYTAFDSGSTGIDLGISCRRSDNGNKVSLFNLEKMISFDLNSSTCYNEVTDEPIPVQAIRRNGVPYLPAGTVCSFFGLRYSYTEVEGIGHLVRIKSADVVLSDRKFIEAASDLFSRRLREYNQSLGGSTVQPSDPGPTMDSETPEDGAEVAVYLAFRCDETAGLDEILDTLDTRGQWGAFFFPADVLAEAGEVIDRIVASGHKIGLLAEGDTAQVTQTQLAAGRALLERLSCVRTAMALIPGDQVSDLEEQNWICWQETVSAIPAEGVSAASYASGVLRTLRRTSGTAYVTLDGGENSARVLPALLQQMKGQSFVVR
ncbi:MAG: hypothetical protein IKK44_03635, partial [Clostridium sp.]|nr:hypothetical protein [Clostridium sp.]